MRNYSILSVVFVLLSFSCIRANIWDNLFYDEVVEISFPEEFLLKLSGKFLFGKLELIIKSSSYLKKMSIVQSAQFSATGLNTRISENVFDSDQQLITSHSIFQSCSKISLPPIQRNPFDFVNGILPLVSLTLDHEKVGDLYKVHTSKILQLLNITQDVILYYNQHSELQKIEIEIAEGQKASFDVVEFTEVSLDEKDFDIPKKWGCDKVETVPYNEVKPQDFLKNIFKGTIDKNFDAESLLKKLPADQIPEELKKRLEDLKKNRP